jgi:hypothetical protein
MVSGRGLREALEGVEREERGACRATRLREDEKKSEDSREMKTKAERLAELIRRPRDLRTPMPTLLSV